ncbi:hypothetical protein SAMN05660903_02024 [Salegentibacter salinarum]|uniref:SDR family oxidoreductase n=1 Tax=Salegentibacter salinarum TaxID=447422 RepID=UPI0009C90685|nr:SDR family oxidoreductase [Salegentibacter salinarum]SKB68133.1 hypothetical protein SAMN05660903_02024 [Salegentibacter salinarum]
MEKDNKRLKNPVEKYKSEPFKEQEVPVVEKEMDPKPDHKEESYLGCNKLLGRKALITGGDSGIGKAVAIAFAYEGVDVLISYLNEHEDAKETAKYVEETGKKAILAPGDIQEESYCKELVEKAVKELGGLDIVVNNSAFQRFRESLQDISTEEWDRTFKTNLYPLFHIFKAAEPHLKPGSTVINTTSVNASNPKPTLAPYTATKGAIQNFTASLGQLWAEKGIRVNCVASRPIWTPLIPATFPADEVSKFGQDKPLGRAGQQAEMAPI